MPAFGIIFISENALTQAVEEKKTGDFQTFVIDAMDYSRTKGLFYLKKKVLFQGEM